MPRGTRQRHAAATRAPRGPRQRHVIAGRSGSGTHAGGEPRRLRGRGWACWKEGNEGSLEVAAPLYIGRRSCSDEQLRGGGLGGVQAQPEEEGARGGVPRDPKLTRIAMERSGRPGEA